jgi:hypothetical protein
MCITTEFYCILASFVLVCEPPINDKRYMEEQRRSNEGLLLCLSSVHLVLYFEFLISKLWKRCWYFIDSLLVQELINLSQHTISSPLSIPPFFLGAFAELRKMTISFVMSIRLPFRPSVSTSFRIETVRLPLDRFSWNSILDNFSKICRKNSVSLKSEKNRGYFTGGPVYILNYISLSPSFNYKCLTHIF